MLRVRLLLILIGLALAGCRRDDPQRCHDALCADAAGRAVCVRLEEDPAHCGECGNWCGSGVCGAGACVEACGPGETTCGGDCVVLDSAESHCGACNNPCGAGETCASGECTDDTPCDGGDCVCTLGRELCGDRCVALDRNVLHCGSCDNVCPSDQECVDGSCICPEGTEACWLECIDTSSDRRNCGACGEVCPNGTNCEDGTCECPSGLTSCDDTCVDLLSSQYHCGTCGGRCQDGATCVAGDCQVPVDPCSLQPTDLDLVRVTLSQAVDVELATGAVAVDRNERAVEVVAGRDALFRVFVDPGSASFGKEISARLTIKNLAEVETYVAHLTLGGASAQEELSSTLNLHVPARMIQEDTEYSVELTTCAPVAVGPSGVTRVPAGTAMLPLLAVPTSDIKVVVVPVIHDGRLPDTSPAAMEVFEREVERQFPTVDMEISVIDPIVSVEQGIVPDLGLILDQITEKRADDQATDDLYYFGLVDPAGSVSEYCDGGCTTGIAWLLEGTGAWARQHRAGVSVGFGTFGANTMAHEIGHNMGRDHAPCGVKGDANYPHPRGNIGVWGYDSITGVLKAPTLFSDLMSYCEPNWISDYTYRAIHDRLLSTANKSLAHESGPERVWATLLITRTSARWVRPSRLRGAPTARVDIGVVYDVLGMPLHEVEVHRLKLADDDGYKLLVPPAQPGWFAVGLKGGRIVAY